jgi:hypothetical protein
VKEIREYDVVRVVNLRKENRPFDGTTGVMRPPRIGDVGTVVHEYKPEDLTAPVRVENVDEKGMTIWLADFERDELELVIDMRDYEKQVARVLLGAAGIEALFEVLATVVDTEYEYTGHGYFLTLKHPSLPAERLVLDTPMISGRAKGVEEVGFVAFLENHEFALECFSYGDGIPEDFRDRNVEIQIGERPEV